MRWSRQGLAPLKVALVSASFGLTAALGGCATSTSQTAVAQAPRIDMEDDGLPAQLAPSRQIRQLPDDPAEPFSPNYGPRVHWPGPAAPMRLSQAEEDGIITRAIVAHEMRRP